MLNPPLFGRFEDAYTAVLEHVGHGFEHVIAARGNDARESLNLSFVLEDPRDRLVFTPARKTNIVFCYAEALWFLWGRNDLDMIGYYAPTIAKNSADGKTLTGSAYGTKMFKPDGSGRTQWQQVVELLGAEDGSKRAVMQIFDAAELADPANPNVSCTLGIQFLLRDGCLHAVTYMRGNDAILGLLNDVFSATLIQEFTANALGVRLGSYGHHVGSMHINDVDTAMAEEIVATAHQDHPRFTPVPMPQTSFADLKVIEGYEERLRLDESPLGRTDAAFQALHPYWQQAVVLFEAYRQINHHPDGPIDTRTFAALTPAHQYLVGNRWPGHLPGGQAAALVPERGEAG